MRFARSKRRTFSMIRIPLIALIDVVLFLLLYFMMAGELASAGEGQLSSTLQTEKKAAASNLQAQILRVDPAPGGVMFVIGERRAASAPELLSVLKSLPKDAGVLVRVSGEVPIEHAAAAVQACRDAGFVKVSYVPSTR